MSDLVLATRNAGKIADLQGLIDSEPGLDGLRDGRHRVIGLGRADDRYFTFAAGVGLDAAVVRGSLE